MKLLTILGARPQFVKAAVMSRAISRQKESFSEVIVHTGQHYDENMSQIFFDELDIPQPNYFLKTGGGSHAEMTAKMLVELEGIMQKEKPDVVLVYGDTNTTLSGALAAVKIHIPVVHVEAGLRSYNKRMPEEVNRVLCDHCSTLLFTPTNEGKQNLLKEGVTESSIAVVGDIMYDAVLYYAKKAQEKSSILAQLELENKSFVLATCHRQENTDVEDRLENILEALAEIAKEETVVLPLHPRTKKCLEQKGLDKKYQNAIRFIPPVSYFDMLALESSAKLVITDSGGVQKEAYFFQAPCLILRDESEWTELIEAGYATLVGANKSNILEAYQDMSAQKIQWRDSIYGDGSCAEKILECLSKTFAKTYQNV